jgi:NAD(P)-dependent dehydrogenase (short-subunit alcohol dehydrogenase family)
MSEAKKHVIGGITGGIGKALAKDLLEHGHKVGGFSLSGECDDLDGAQIHRCDASDPDALESTLEDLYDEMGGIDCYTHAIGSIFIRAAHMTKPDDWQKTIRLNLDSAFYALRVVAKRMSKQGSGSCLFFSTAAAQTGIANHEAIAAAKGGIEAMVRSAAASYSSRGVRFNAIAPSLTDTPLSKDILNSEKALEISKRMHPLGDITDKEDVASLASWLHSDSAKFATGQIYVLDGGISTIVPKPKA